MPYAASRSNRSRIWTWTLKERKYRTEKKRKEKNTHIEGKKDTKWVYGVLKF
jgi:hypothetical protein